MKMCCSKTTHNLLPTKQTKIIIVSLPVDLNIAVVAVVACQSCHSYFGDVVDASSGSSVGHIKSIIDYDWD